MRIFYASEATPNASIKSNIWRNNLYLSLIDAGHQVIEFEYDFGDTFNNLDPSIYEQKKFIDINRPKLSETLLKKIKEAHIKKPIDLFFSYFYDACILPETIEDIKSLGITTINWYCNGSYQIHLVSEISPHYDWCLVPEKFRIKDYLKMGAKPIYCQEAANPNIYKPYSVDKEFDVTFVGQAYGERPNYIKYLYSQGINIRVWGPSWHDLKPIEQRKSVTQAIEIGRKLLNPNKWNKIPSLLTKKITKKNKNIAHFSHDVNKIILPNEILGNPLSDLDMIKMYSRSKINLGFSSCGDTHLTNERIVQVRLRDFEVPMSGGFYMVEYMEELEEFFNIGKEIVCYNTPEDLLDKIKYYLNNDSEREKIRQAGYERCLKDHSWQKRFEMVFRQIGLV
jgi:spore maturation protein CgeB